MSVNPPRAVLVTGAAGLIGVPVVRTLLAHGFRVIAVDDGSAGTLDRFEEFANLADLRLRVLDIRHRSKLISLMAAEHLWGVVHLAAQHFICATQPPKRLVFASTADVYAPSDNPHDEDDPIGPLGVYGWSKLFGERLLGDQQHRIGACDVVIARLFNVYGPSDPHPHLLPETIRQARHGRTLHLGDLGAARDFVYVDDVVEALVALLCAPCAGVVNVGTGTSVLGRELVELVTGLIERRLETRVDSERIRRRSRSISCAKTNRLQEMLPWWPRTPLREGISHTITADLHANGGKGEHLRS